MKLIKQRGEGEKKSYPPLWSSPIGSLLSCKIPAGDSPPTSTKLVQQKSMEEWLTAPRLLPALFQGGWLHAENQFPSLCPDTSQELRDFMAEQCCAFTIELWGAETHWEATTLVLFHYVQPVTTAISWRAHFSNPHLFGNPGYHYFVTKRHRLKEV